MDQMHPTKVKLIETTATLLDDHRPDALHVEQVLEASGISWGSLYHHFEDFPDLIETALVLRFSREVDATIGFITKLVSECSSAEDFRAGLRRVTVATQAPGLTGVRMERARLVSRAQGNERLLGRLGSEQLRLTHALGDLFREAQEKGWHTREFDPHAGAVLIQAYTLGKVVDDVVPDDDRMDPEAWNALIFRLIDRVFASE